MPDYKEILYDKQRSGVLLTLNRPEALNAITRPMLKEIHHALDQAEADPEIRAIEVVNARHAGHATHRQGFDDRRAIARQGVRGGH